MSLKKPGFFVKQVIAWLLKRRESYGIHDCHIFAAIDCMRIYFVSFNFLSLENPSKYWWPFCFKRLRKTSTADALLEKLIVKWNVKLWKKKTEIDSGAPN